ncbi:MAG: hypothetical protein MI747_23060 [Desulfobacterales bacterium]|nr:hypothetical protein [Desulfobacterales bacterium]
MESNFYLETQTRNQKLHIKLHGVFDGASAFELIDKIQEYPEQRIVIETGSITRAHDYGRHILQCRLPKAVKRSRLLFSGDHARRIMPQGCRLLKHGHGKDHVCTGRCKNCTCRKPVGNDDVLDGLRNGHFAHE